jgi:hypothetical protein
MIHSTSIRAGNLAVRAVSGKFYAEVNIARALSASNYTEARCHGAAKCRVKQALALRRSLPDTRAHEKKINYNGTPHAVEEFAPHVSFVEGDRTQWMQRLL